VQQLLGIGAAAGSKAHLSHQPIPEFAVNQKIRHGFPKPDDVAAEIPRAQTCAQPRTKANAFRASIVLLRRTPRWNAVAQSWINTGTKLAGSIASLALAGKNFAL
jgi:hypothetical protein